ncbi:tRNA 2-thiouridine-synthesizing protein [Pseudoalteromonas aurantia]|uniref:tRNA 2-thiouridine-synthesizing protein n=1 Tax=Pseudoalteromonas aurantia TaxID=43654 RepID=A0A5S3V866_9GAMM|nr:tRNA 2-thiouridine-synthesizing protein [Pseudoalteromonas aurantia]TMO65682.1 tRNA 2-thiouridine-synthesizing protein [Pseudoalteromonas aurantia]TMO68039.1 tRNA 2-thiouridine-synthesizing protein [Pseudoalteromonas aurantia]TMO74037.1 tRNA 2-thiouridine-synthesizing protein [Pseudoalteromonas aurantia]
MNTLHIFSKPLSTFNSVTVTSLISDSDGILLMGEACFDQASYQNLASQQYVLSHCLVARGITAHPSFSSISDVEWVTLIDNAKKSITW